MYKEYREMSRTEAVDALYQDMAARHRARFRSIHVCYHNHFILIFVFTNTAVALDSQSCRNREDQRCQASLLEATSYEKSQIPSPTSRCQKHKQEALLSSSTFYLCLRSHHSKGGYLFLSRFNFGRLPGTQRSRTAPGL